MAGISVVDFGRYSLDVRGEDAVADRDLRALASDVWEALTSTGVLYLRNHGLPQRTIDKMNSSSLTFFNLPEEKKYKSEFNNDTYIGWMPPTENLNPEKKGDIKESINFCSQGDKDYEVWPTADVPTLLDDFKLGFNQCNELSRRVMQMIALGIGKEINFFDQFHRRNGQDRNRTMIRSLYYPPIPDDFKGDPDQLRLGEHSDYGSVTLLFQDDVGGLQVMNRAGDFIEATPMEGCVLVLIADVMQMWCENRIIAQRHRVAIPSSPEKRKRARRSTSFFVNADDDVLVTLPDGRKMTMDEFLAYKVHLIRDTTNY